ncbi:MAG: valine--tRNA ligase [Coriobacteriales bacterium]|nr:valine--tRNA ligase [Coriobacteriales bacterium]
MPENQTTESENQTVSKKLPELPPTYNPKDIESRWFSVWQQQGYFSRDAGGFANNDKPPYTVVIPPPNVTGVLHMGHALNNTLQDILVRKARMQGRPTRWILGTDHAGIATQNRVEQKLAAEGLSRFDLGRDAFIEACWQWREEYGSTIIEQLKAVGCSCDYADERFTMDTAYAQAVRKVFVNWYVNGLIYRGNRIINWCPRCTTALADDEVVHHEEAGKLWHLRYPLDKPVDGVEYLVVATTRPETMLGDTAVAVNPNDQRYQALVATKAQVRLPLTDRVIPIIADDYVDPAFGTGALKVTPAHDPNDFELGKRHGLEQINIFDERAYVNAAGGDFSGLSREQAREAVVKALEDQDLLEQITEHQHTVGHCYRCDTTIEPWLSEQWFVAMQKLAAPAIAAAREGRLRFYPQRWQNVYLNWLENIHDWCISRQLWWGHRIPVFYCDTCGWSDALAEDQTRCPICGAQLRQDDDVLDTWFSSQLWPFATYGWPSQPDSKQQLAAYYPTQVLSTARDIIFLWVARMVISSLYFMEGQLPFGDVLVHPTVLDAEGNIMSKSRGNGVDPMELIDSYGADGMRFGLALQVTGTQDLRFNPDNLLKYRHFANKIWNATRYVLLNIADLDLGDEAVRPMPTTDADRWILSRLARLCLYLDDEAHTYDFGASARALHEFFWNEFCDWYIELAKSQTARKPLRASTASNLVYVLEVALRLLHPYMPHLTEELWQALPHGVGVPHLIVAPWPDSLGLTRFIDEAAEQHIDRLRAIVSAVRSTRARYGISPKQGLRVAVNVAGGDEEAKIKAAALNQQADLIRSLARLDALAISSGLRRPEQAALSVVDDLEIFVELVGIVDVKAELARLKKEQTKLTGDLAQLTKKLDNHGFIAKADPSIIEKTREDAAGLTSALERLHAQIEALR